MSALRPDFIDNQDGNTLARALQAVLGAATMEGVGDVGRTPDEVRIATAFFSATGYAHIAELLGPVPSVRLLLGADRTGRLDDRRALGETQRAFKKRITADGLAHAEQALRMDRDRLPFTRASGDSLRKLVAALRAGNVEVRLYKKAFLHAKAYIHGSGARGRPEGAIVGSANLTGAGLVSNLELSLGRYERPVVERSREWFDALWDDAEPYDLAAVFDQALKLHTPWEIFIRVLWQLYGEEVAEDARQDQDQDQDLRLTHFQRHGVARALRLIQQTGGALVADEVGLGKTFIAGEVLKIYGERRQRVLLVCPAALRDSTWRSFRSKHQIFVECVSFEQLAGDCRLRAEGGREILKRPLHEYQLVVVDEAHNYRNPKTETRAVTLERLLSGQRRDLLLLTATPVNNSLWDLHTLIRFFIRQDAHFASRGILSLKGRFEQAAREDPSSLSPDILYPVIDATTVKRTRQFVKKHYEKDQITGADGQPQAIVFPKPVPMNVHYQLDDLLPGFFDRLEAALDPEGTKRVVFARYYPDAYRRHADAEERIHQEAMVGLLRSGLLKRFESSAYAFHKTVDKMIAQHETFLRALDAGRVVSTQFMQELSADDEAVFEEVLEESEHTEAAAHFDSQALRADVERDRDILRGLADEARSISADRDPKLKALAEELLKVAEQANTDAVDKADEAQKRKVLVFSFFADTVDWIETYLARELKRRPELACYRGRMVTVTGSRHTEGASRRSAVHGFAPVSMEAVDIPDRYDILISTDVLAEGVNLQQCRHIVNFDVPWNPMRLVQRHGRIDRIGSPHPHVYLRTIFPVDRLEQLLKLEERILRKLAMAAASVGVSTPVKGGAQGGQVFSETRSEIEKLLKEDASLYERGGPESAAQSGEEYRQTLRKELQKGSDPESLPWKAGSAMAKGARRGVFFCAIVGERPFLRFVPADEQWEMSEDGVVRELGTCLRLIECKPTTPRHVPEGLRDRVYDFWARAQQDVWDEWMEQTDPANLQPYVRPLNLRVAEHIRSHVPAGMKQQRMQDALDVLESPWSRRDEVLLRGWFETSGEAGAKLSETLVERILATGLEASRPPDPLPPIDIEDVELLCWLGIETADAASRVRDAKTPD